MKGGVPCLGSMFSRKTKNVLADDTVIFQNKSEGCLPSSTKEDMRFSSMFLPEKDMTVTFTSRDMRSTAGEGESHIFVPNEGVARLVEVAAPSIHESDDLGHIGVEIDASDRPAGHFSSEYGTGEAEYEGEDEDEEMINLNTLAQGTHYCDSDRPASDGASDHFLNRQCPAHTEVLDNDSARYYEEFVAGTYGVNVERQNSFTNLEVASGHVSDPGVYHAKRPESICSSPILVCNGQSKYKEKNEEQLPKQASLGVLGQSENLGALFGHGIMHTSYDSSSAGGEARNLASAACVATEGRPRSEGAYQCTANHAVFKLGAASKALDGQKKKPWWKIFLVSHRNIHRKDSGEVLGSLSEGEVERLPPVYGYVSDVSARSGRRSPSVLNEGVSDSEKEQGNLRGSEVEIRSQVSAHTHEREFHENVEALGALDVFVTDRNVESSAIPSHQVGDFAANLNSFGTDGKWDSTTGKTGLSRVEEWVSSVQPIAPFLDDDQVEIDESPGSPTASAASFFKHFGNESEDSQHVPSAVSRGDGTAVADAEMAKMVARLVNPLSTVAHFSGVGLKVVPSLGMFGNLKTLTLSANNFVRIAPGCLPKSLHSLDISRNNIVLIEGLRELTRLRVLNLSFNRISRIGNGLSSCTSLKEVYMAGNKISEVEGLHRLSKLVVLDLSFNKLTTTKSLGQIAANYKSLQALNLLGNTVHSNLGDEQMRRFVTGVCPQLVYLNKQAVKPVSNREALGKELKASVKSTSKPSKRGSGHQSVQSHRRAHSGGVGGSVKGKAGGKGMVSPVLGSQGESHHRKSHHHTRPTSSSRELPKGFVPLPPTAHAFHAGHRSRASEPSEKNAMPRVKSDGVLFREDYHWASTTTTSRGVVRAH